MSDITSFPTRVQASAAAAHCLAACIRGGLERHARTTLVVSGGSTPQHCFRFLSDDTLDWRRVRVALTDERWVPATHEASNEAMVRRNLIANAAADAELLHIYQSDMTVDERCDSLQSELIGQSIAASLIGIGADGHFASLFPDADNLGVGLHRGTQHFYIPIKTDASPHARVSLTLAALLQSDMLVLLFFGDAKRRVAEAAFGGDDRYPLTQLLGQSDVPVRIFWAP